MEEVRYYNSPITLEEAEQYIQSGLITAARAYVANGFYLRRIREDKLFEVAGYQNFEDYVRGKYNKDKGWASKCIKVNQQLSEEGNSPILSKQYLEYSTYQLVELAYMSEEQREEEADPDMTVNQLKQIRKPDEVVELEKSCDITTSEPKEEQEQEPEETQDRTVYVKEQYRLKESFLYPFSVWLIKNHKAWFAEDHMSRVLKVDKSEPQLKAYLGASQSGFRSFGFPVDNDTYYAKMYDDGIEISHFTDIGFTVIDGMSEWFYLAASVQVQWNVVALEEAQEERRQESGTFNAAPISCSAVSDGLKGEDHEIDHFLNQNKSIDDAYGWFRSEMVKEYLKTGYKDPNEECRIIVLGSMHRVLKRKDVTVFYDTSGTATFDVENGRLEREYNYFFGDQNTAESESKEPENVSEQAESVPDTPENIIDGEFVEVLPEPETTEYAPRYFLEEQKRKLDEYLQILAKVELGPADIKLLERQKTIVAALAAMVAELERPEPEPELEKQEQPELPILKNNDQRKEFIETYETWPIWIDQKETGERYYRYDLSDKVAMVVKVSWKHSWSSYKESKDYEYSAEQYYLLGVRSEWSANARSVYVEDETRTFYECSTNMTALVEYLKDFQKKK